MHEGDRHSAPSDADTHCLIEPCRTSPTVKMPGMLVSR